MAQLKVQTLADNILEVQAKIAAITETLKPLKEMEDQLYEQMLAEFKVKRMDGWKTDSGVSFSRAFRTGYEIVDRQKALEWATAHDCVSVDKTAMAKRLKGAGAIPEGIEYKETEYLVVKQIKDEQI